ncbi:MAG: hypothetical protein LBC13_03770 [Clostridiales bacterium]|jgi:4-diphosphocytidyl-2-C-methyl-D-erythritol kinase|nr:hypothetical protein [Clostridiales bacterium]
MSVTLNAYAKINLGLNVTGRSGGLHTIDTVMCTVSLCDEITVERSADGMNQVFSDTQVDGENSAARAARLYTSAFGGGYRIKIKKKIPFGAGLGGSSADAAGVFRALAALNGREPAADMLSAAGSDVPFMYSGGAARVRGTGGECLALTFPKRRVLIAVPPFSVSTAAAYAAYDAVGGDEADILRIAEALQSGDIYAFNGCLKNALFRGAAETEPRLKNFADLVEKACRPFGAPFVMTGSGSGFAVLANDGDLLKISKILKSASRVFITEIQGGC